jgi:Tfp pilus assembly protein PilV
MMLKKNAGTTLIEVLVASGILVSIITLLTVALTSTFEGYSRVLSSAQVEQDAQYITARLQYATTRADRNTLAYHTTSTDFSTGALYQTQVNTSSNGEVGLS